MFWLGVMNHSFAARAESKCVSTLELCLHFDFAQGENATGTNISSNLDFVRSLWRLGLVLAAGNRFPGSPAHYRAG
jgi:hypothetical protein